VTGIGRFLRTLTALISFLGATAAHADDEEMISNGKAAVIAKLVDPDSAHFTDLRVITKNGQKFACGFVDEKNRKGGYDGAKPFMFITAEKRAQHSAIIYGARAVTDDRFSAFAEPAAFNDICGG
jgi:hypothetical protein